ncbi:MAG: hypothetical protein MI749_11080 [Desulfovibrionales bacterium]|nr:hypothetical protein [Desulfovibrionales bacterium]
MTLIVSIVIFLIAVIGFGLITRNLKKKSPAPAARPQRPQPEAPKNPAAELAKILDALLALNLMIRKDPNFSLELTLALETIMDDLKNIIPSMMERYPGETLTYELKQIGDTHLHRIVKEFMDLSPEIRETQLPTFKSNLAGIQDVVTRAREIVDKNEIAEFQTMAHFLAGKFS